MFFSPQVPAAFEHLSKNCENHERDVRFSVKCNNAKGIHIRGKSAFKPQNYSVKVRALE